MSILDHVSNRYFKTPTAVAEDIVARFVEMKRHLEESENRFRSTWAYRYEMDRKWLDDAKTGIIQGTESFLIPLKAICWGMRPLFHRKFRIASQMRNPELLFQRI
jgi:hypothetical protein